MIAFNRLLEKALAEVEEDRRAERGKHLAPDAPTNARCPTEPFIIACPCSKQSPSHPDYLLPLRGPTLILVPARLIDTWINEFEKVFGEDSEHDVMAQWMNMTLLVGHGDTTRKRKTV